MRKIITVLLSAVLFASCNKTQTADNSITESPTSKTENLSLPIGVVNSDSILEKYQFAVEAREKLTKKEEDARLSFSIQGQQLQRETADFQKKYENHAFLSQERAEQEYARLQRKQQEIQEHGAKLEKEYMLEMEKLGKQLKDSIDLAISVLNKDKRYALIITTSAASDNVLYTAPENDITKQVLDFLSKRKKDK
jgi:outer membrane protein